VHLETASWETTRRVLDMSGFPEVEEIHTVAGDTAMILKVRTESPAALEDLLGKLHRMEGFRGVKTFIALGTYLERVPLPA
jgi:DNA-binding Lrp family transcriptional regulator